jgi:hypothetical protein
VVEDDIVTGVVSFVDASPGSEKSIVAAMALSAALPGMGHYYLDKPTGAFVYLSVDLASIFGAVLFHALAGQRERDARSYAAHAAGIERPRDGEAYWRDVGKFMDAAEYNESVELSRGGGELYDDPASWWRWGDGGQKSEYNDLRQKARNMRVASSFFIGALVANRVVSVVDLRVFHKRARSRGVRFESAFAPDMSGASLALKADF